MPLPPGVDVRRAGDRYLTRADGRDCRHSFSSGSHYDPANVAYGALVAHDDHRLGPGVGFPLHRHRNVEIVSWVAEGTLVHEDSTGRRGSARPGLVQRLSAGRGVEHSERNGSAQSPLRVVQMWVLPDDSGRAPGYASAEVDDRLAGGALVPVASGRPGDDAAVSISTGRAALHAARPGVGMVVRLPDAPLVHLFVVRGGVELEDVGALDAGDAVRLPGDGGRLVTARAPAELLVWELQASAPGPPGYIRRRSFSRGGRPSGSNSVR